MGEVIRAAAIAGVVSGAPSTAHALLRRGDPLEASLAAGTLLLASETRRGRLLLAGAVVHAGLCLGWAGILAAVLPRRRAIPAAAAAGLAIAGLDLGIVGRRLPRIRALPIIPQVADHVAFAVTVAAVLRPATGGSRAPRRTRRRC
ncbi:MAG: hypothetical protein QOE44_2415 [Solirubrobacteraceae bacterium]|nr:hypothetical protein [Solirubrobacteraceae bacterium]